jgi:hypothetical protein
MNEINNIIPENILYYKLANSIFLYKSLSEFIICSNVYEFISNYSIKCGKCSGSNPIKLIVTTIDVIISVKLETKKAINNT